MTRTARTIVEENLFAEQLAELFPDPQEGDAQINAIKMKLSLCASFLGFPDVATSARGLVRALKLEDRPRFPGFTVYFTVDPDGAVCLEELVRIH